MTLVGIPSKVSKFFLSFSENDSDVYFMKYNQPFPLVIGIVNGDFLCYISFSSDDFYFYFWNVLLLSLHHSKSRVIIIIGNQT